MTMRILRAPVWLLALSSVSAQVKLPEGDGKTLVETVCTSCHDIETAIDTKHTEAEWKDVVDSMAARGADATDAQFATIVKYLAKNFGKAGDKPKAAAEKSVGASDAKSESSKATLKFDAKNDWAASGRDEAGQRF